MAVRWLLPLLARAFVARIRSQCWRALCVHSRLQGSPQAVALADENCADERRNSDKDPHVDDGIYEKEGSDGLIAIVAVEVRENKNGDVYEHIKAGDQVEDGGDEEMHC